MINKQEVLSTMNKNRADMWPVSDGTGCPVEVAASQPRRVEV